MTKEQDIVERLLEASGEATLKAWSVDVGKDKYQNASVLFAEAAQTIAALLAERDEAQERIELLSNLPRGGISRVQLVALRDRAEAAERKVVELEAEIVLLKENHQ